MIELEPPRVVERSALRLAGMRDRYSRESVDQVPAAWKRFMRHIGKVPGQLDDVAYGACFNTDRDGGFEYMAAVEVDHDARLPAPFTTLRIPEHRYAVFVHRGHISAIGRTWTQIYGRGLFEAGLAPASAPSFERYDHRFDPSTGEGQVEIWVSIAG